jgi:hypothetical protein
MLGGPLDAAARAGEDGFWDSQGVGFRAELQRLWRYLFVPLSGHPPGAFPMETSPHAAHRTALCLSGWEH